MLLPAGGGPTTPDPRVQLAQTTPVIGQFDPAFTSVMDDVMALARSALKTTYPRCFAVSSLAAGGLEAVVCSFVQPGDRLAVVGTHAARARVEALAWGYGATAADTSAIDAGVSLVIVSHVDPATGLAEPIADIARQAHAVGARLIVDATLSLAALDLRVDEWEVDVCLAGVDHALGAPSGMTLVTYSPAMEALLDARATPPRTSYLDLRQLQAYWSPDRLNHHTAPTTLVYGLREALRCVLEEGMQSVVDRHARTGAALRAGLSKLGLHVTGEGPYAVTRLPSDVLERTTESALRARLRDEHGVAVTPVDDTTWLVGLLGHVARADAVNRVLASVAAVLERA